MTARPSPFNRPVRILMLVVALIAASWIGKVYIDSGSERPYKFTRFAMDTIVEYTIRAPSREQAFLAMLSAHEEIERVEGLLWEENPGSAIHALNSGVSIENIPPERRSEVTGFLNRLGRYHRRSGGRFDPAIGSALALYGFGTETPRVPDAPELLRAMEHSDFDQFSVDPAVKLAVGGVAKGYAVDRAVAELRRHGITSALVNAGGDMFALGADGPRAWMVGVTHPGHPDRLIDTLYVTNAAVATSGDYQRYFETDGIRYHHLLNPTTGTPARAARSATVVAPGAEEADAMATGLFVAGPESGREMMDLYPDLSGMIIDPGYGRLYTHGFDRHTIGQ